MRAQFLAASITLLLASAPSTAQPHSIFEVDGKRPQTILVAPDEGSVKEPWGDSTMVHATHGLLGSLKGSSAITRLFATIKADEHWEGSLEDADRFCVLHLLGAETTRQVAILRSREGDYVAEEIDPPNGIARQIALRRPAFETLSAGWNVFRADLYERPNDVPMGEVFELAKPYVPSRIVLDDATLKSRFWMRQRGKTPTVDRDLTVEQLFVRLPEGYHPSIPAGLLVWVSPSHQGGIPRVFTRAADELNLICVGAAQSGNSRVVSSRLQLAFDGIENVSRRFHVDPRRIYVTGMSGGGRVSSILLGCYPEVFAGAVPIVGLSIYRNVPAGNGNFWPAGYTKPTGRMFGLLRQRRFAPITGPEDFNSVEMNRAAQMIRGDGLKVRMFNYDGMAHVMPTTEQFMDPMRWVDEPYREQREKETADAQQFLDRFMARYADQELGRRQLELLNKVTEIGPWTDAAWRGVEEEGRERGVEGRRGRGEKDLR